MEYVNAFISLFAGLGAFLIGFKILSDNIGKLANSGLKSLFNKTSKNRFVGVGIGALVTAIIQSSGAATVMVVGFVNAGIMDLFQATAIIMGANIGTTVTAQIIALNSLQAGSGSTSVSIMLFFTLFTFIGMFGTMVVKKDRPKAIFMALAGLGLVFLALEFMTSAMIPLRTDPNVTNLLKSINNPFLLLFVGILLTALLQSSSAVTTILITMSVAGLTFGKTSNGVLFVIIGSNIGSCLTALLSSIGASTNAKRASFIHLAFNVLAGLIFFVILLIFKDFMDDTLAKWFPGHLAIQIAMFHTIFNVISTLLFLPCIKYFVILAQFFVKDSENKIVLTNIDDRFLKTPSIAIAQVVKEAVRVGELSMITLDKSIQGFLDKDTSIAEDVRKSISDIEIINENIIEYLIKLSSQHITVDEEKTISNMHHCLNDFYREAEIADNMLKYTKHLVDDDLEFSDNVFLSISELRDKLNKQFGYVKEIMLNKNYSLLTDVDKIEEEIDDMRSKLIKSHIKRLEEGTCSPMSNGVFINLVSNLERGGDHLNYIAHLMIEED